MTYNDYQRYYQREYYTTYGKLQINCPLCDSVVVKSKLIRHQKTKICNKLSLDKLNNQ
jgi:hypothetical protein